jgi:hypothetical protein
MANKTNTAVDLFNLPHIKKAELFTRTVMGRIENRHNDYLEVQYDVQGWWNNAPIYLRLDRDYKYDDGSLGEMFWALRTSSGGTSSGISALDRIKILQAILADMVELMDELGYN